MPLNEHGQRSLGVLGAGAGHLAIGTQIGRGAGAGQGRRAPGLGGVLLSRPAKVERYWAFAGLGSKMPANVCLWYQKAGLGA